jgi:hypothetical protein
MHLSMANFDPYIIIEHAMHDTLDSLKKSCLCASHLDKVHFVAVLAYGCGSYKEISRAQFVILQRKDVLGRYSQSIPLPVVAGWSYKGHLANMPILQC